MAARGVPLGGRRRRTCGGDANGDERLFSDSLSVGSAVGSAVRPIHPALVRLPNPVGILLAYRWSFGILLRASWSRLELGGRVMVE